MFPTLRRLAWQTGAVLDQSGTITMSMGELDRLKVVQALVDGLLKPGTVARKLGLTVCQVHGS